MEVQASTQNTYTSQTKSVTTKESNSSNNFMSYLDNVNPSSFDNLEDDIERLYRSIMDDDSITGKELSELSYDQVKEFNEWLFKSLNDVVDGTTENFDKIPAFGADRGANLLVASTQLTSDNTFNKTMFKSMKDMNLSDSEKAHIFSELEKSISQSHNNQNLSLPYTAGTIHEYKRPGEVYTIQGNYNDLLTNLDSIIEKRLEKPIAETFKKQLEFLQENYKLIQTNYNEILTEEKNILNEITKNNRPNILMER